MEKYDLIIIGSGIAGLSAARAFKEQASDKSLLIINGEDRSPYKRTKVSKCITMGFEKEEFSISDKYINCNDLVQEKVEKIDFHGQTLKLTNQKEYAWKTLVLATGAQAKKAYIPNSLVVRTAQDSEELVLASQNCRTAAIIGGGVLSVELAEQLQKKGSQVTIYLQKSRLINDAFTPYMSEHLDRVLSSHTIQCKYNCINNHVTYNQPGFTITDNQESRHYDLLLECIGTKPNTGLCDSSPISINTGILTNTFMQTSQESVFAAGDCVEFIDKKVTHLWHQAEDQGFYAGKNAALYLQGKSLERFPDQKRRMKLEVYGQYYFSQNYSSSTAYDHSLKKEDDQKYQEFFFKSHQLSAITMIGDKTGAKGYEQALWENWPPEKIKSHFLEN